jgi:hypothetical protein
MITEWWIGGLEKKKTCNIGSGLVCICIDNALDKRRFFGDSREGIGDGPNQRRDGEARLCSLLL